MASRLDFIRESIRHEDGLFAQRANFFLLSQTIFIAAYSQTSTDDKNLKSVLIGLGLFTIAIWIIVSIRNIILIIRLREVENEEMKNPDTEALPIVGWNKLSSNNLIGILFPCAFLVAWLFILLQCTTNL